MSAIAGVYRLDGRPVDRGKLERMIESLAHRGPDGNGAWADGPVGLGHLMLHTTPESINEKLPLGRRNGNLVITADARIDNRGELINALGVADHPLEEISDSNLILRAYEQWGERCPERLIGDFAFAIWDKQKHQLFCARDHMGVKPFYYHHRPGKLFAFGTEIKGLLCVDGVPQKLNELRVADFLVSNFEDQEITFYQDILRLPPAHSVTIGPQGVSARTYWSLDPSRKLQFRSNEEYDEVFRELFTEAVRCRLRSAFPAGSMLSGGLDSSSIVCVARDLLAKKRGQRLHTFSAIFPDVPQSDESAFIDAVVAQGGLDPHSVRADLLSPLSAELEHVLCYEDEVLWAPYLYIHWGLQSAAHQQGVRILLDGDGGDDTVSHSYAYLTELARMGHWRSLGTELREIPRRQNFSPWRLLMQFVLKPLAPEAVRRAWRVASRRNRRPWRIPYAIISPNFARHIGLAERVRALSRAQSKRPRTAREDQWRLLNRGANSYAFEIMDKIAAPFCIEKRYPFLDVRLVEYCLALPPEQKLSGGWTRVIMRRALTSLLPEKVRLRGDKGNVDPAFAQTLLLFNQGLLEEVVLKYAWALEKYADIVALREEYSKFVSQDGTHESSYKIFKAVTLALWLRQSGLSP